MRIGFPVVVLAAGLSLLTGPGRAQVERQIRIPLDGGRLSLLKLTRALLTEYGYGGDQLRFPDLELDVSGAKGSLLLMGISQSLARTARFRKVDDGATLVVAIDQARVRSIRHKVKRRLGNAISLLTGHDVMARRYELSLPAGLADDETFVLCVHGVDSSSKSFAALRPALAAGPGGIRSGAFDYANDEAIDRIAAQLSAGLAARKKENPDQRVILVAHSMGGLVCRYLLETPALDPGIVTTLIMIATPNHGSRLARLRPGIDALQFLRDHGDNPRLLAPFADGLGEAGWDMWPDSPFLTTLNGRPRNDAIRYHLILGDKGVISTAAMHRLREQVMAKVKRLKKHEIYAPKIAAWLDDLQEPVRGAGDGAVSLARGRLQGVTEVVFPMSHRGLLRPASGADEQPVFEQIRAWVKAARK